MEGILVFLKNEILLLWKISSPLMHKIHEIVFLRHDWSKCVKWLNTPKLKLGNTWVIFPNFFKTVHVVKNIWRIINTIASVGAEICSHICSWTLYLFLKAHSLPQAMFLENCLLFETGKDRNVCGQVVVHIFTWNWGYCLYCHLKTTLHI